MTMVVDERLEFVEGVAAENCGSTLDDRRSLVADSDNRNTLPCQIWLAASELDNGFGSYNATKIPPVRPFLRANILLA